MRRFLILTTTALLVGAVAAACGDDVTGPSSIFGTYNLVSINGERLPVVLGDAVVIGGSIQLNSDSTYTVSMTVDSGDGPETHTSDGTFTVTGSIVDFDSVPDGIISGNTLTIDEGSVVLVFRR